MPKNIEDTKYYSDKYFDFLIKDYGFKRIPEYHVSYEFHLGYRKDKIEIDIACETDGASLPWVTLRNFNKTHKIGNKEYPQYFYLLQIDTPEVLSKIDLRRTNYKLANSEDDYEQFGRNQLETVLKENANIIRRNPEILHGDLKVFPRKEKRGDSSIETYISVTQPDGSVKSYTSTTITKKDGRERNYSSDIRLRKNLFAWIKSFFD